MDRKWTIAEEKRVEVDRRYLKLNAARAIRSVVEALVELITNSDDAYRGLKDQKGKIIIEVTRRRGEKSGDIIVKDRAGGMTINELKEKILKYGGYYAKAKSRGFMGRGAKDIVTLGNATFESIRDGKLNHVEITTEYNAKIMNSIPARDEDYKKFGLKPGKGGMQVKLEVGKKHKVPQHETLLRELQRHYALRDILRRRQILLIDANTKYESLVTYSLPEGELIVDQVFNFQPPYEGAFAELKIFKAPAELESELNEGIIICDEHAVHQRTRFSPDLDQDPIGRRFFGRLECKYIRTLQLELDRVLKIDEKYPDHNPVDIVDPNRRKGLDRDHPFVKILFDWAEDLLQKAVDQVRREESEPKRKVASAETNKRLRELSKAMAQYLKERLEEESLMPRTQEQEAILNTEGVLLNPQFQRISVGEIRRMGYTVLSFGEAEDPEHVTIEVDGEGLKVNPLKPPLEPQKRNPDRLIAYFDVEGITPTEKVTFTVRHKHELILPVTRELEVIEQKDPYADCPYGISFEKHNYTVHDNGTRSLEFVAKGKQFCTVNWGSRGFVESTEPDAIAIMRGKNLKVEKLANELWRGEVQVRGRGIGKRSRITLSVPTEEGQETTSAIVEVVKGKEPPSDVSIKIEFSSEIVGLWRASWDRNNPNLLKVFTKHPTLARYLGREEDEYPGQKHAHFRILLAEIVAGKVVERILAEKIKYNPTDFEDPNTYFFHHSEEMTSFLPIAHKIMISDVEAKMLI